MAIGANSISENFNGLSLGDINGQGSYTNASSWDTTGTGAACSAEVVDSLGSYHLALLDDEAAQKVVCGISLDSGYQSESGYVEFDYLHTSHNFTSYFLLQSTSSENDSICGIGFDDLTEQIRSWDGAAWANLQSFNVNDYYTVKIVFDTDGTTADFYVDNVLKGTKTLVGSTDAVTDLVFRTVNADTSTGVHIDNFVFEGDATAIEPTVTTDSASDITSISATSGGNVTSDGGASVTAKGVCWSTSPNPTTADSTTNDGTGTGVFTTTIPGLSVATTYHVRAYAINSVGTAYGSDEEFTTLATLPTVDTDEASDITATTATSGGNVTDNGGAGVTGRGVCWATAPNPDVNDSLTADGSGSGAFTSSLTGLSPATGYHVRAYAENSIGIAYGDNKQFTSAPDPPTVTTGSTTEIATTTATSGGNVTSDGGSGVTARGVCWATSSSPTTSDSTTSDGTGTGIFESSITGLSPGTTYYVRAYATNSADTSYGSEDIFGTSVAYVDTVTDTVSISPSALFSRTTVDASTSTVSITPSISQTVDYTTTVSNMVSMVPGIISSLQYNVTSTATISLLPSVSDTQTLRNTYEYYFGTDNGTTHIFSDVYNGDAGAIVSCQYVTKDTDFTDQDKLAIDRWKTVYAVKLFYEDVFASTDIIVAISTDGGETWPYSLSKTLGDGDEARKDSTYHFVVTGQFFRFRASNGSASTTFKLLGMEVEYQDAGAHFTVA